MLFWDYLYEHRAVIAVVAYWIFSNLVESLDTPQPTDSRRYKYWFTFLHSVVGSLPRILNTKSKWLPGPDNTKNG